MPILAVLAILALGLAAPALASPAHAGGKADYSLENRPKVVFPGGSVRRSHYPMSRRSAAVWHSDNCFGKCAAEAGWRFEACIRTKGQEACRAQLDYHDRSCVRVCRTRGGPLLVIMD